MPADLDEVVLRATAAKNSSGGVSHCAPPLERAFPLGGPEDLPILMLLHPGPEYGDWVVLSVVGRLNGEPRLSRESSRAWLESGELHVPLFLDASCLDASCAVEEHCVEGRCVGVPQSGAFASDPDGSELPCALDLRP